WPGFFFFQARATILHDGKVGENHVCEEIVQLFKRIGPRFEIAQDESDGVDFAHLSDERVVGLEIFFSLTRWKISKPDLRVGGLFGFVNPRQLVDANVGNFDDAQMNFLFAAVTTDLRLQAREHVEYRRFSRAAMADQAYFHFNSVS